MCVCVSVRASILHVNMCVCVCVLTCMYRGAFGLLQYLLIVGISSTCSCAFGLLLAARHVGICSNCSCAFGLCRAASSSPNAHEQVLLIVLGITIPCVHIHVNARMYVCVCIYRGTFGLVVAAEYRNTSVAVKRVLPSANKKKKQGPVAALASYDAQLAHSSASVDEGVPLRKAQDPTASSTVHSSSFKSSVGKGNGPGKHSGGAKGEGRSEGHQTMVC